MSEIIVLGYRVLKYPYRAEDPEYGAVYLLVPFTYQFISVLEIVRAKLGEVVASPKLLKGAPPLLITRIVE